ncbi:MAG: hypothetical protein ACE5OZ_25670 [Candidatus Heimdallarchaeota archaeon]
MKESCEIASYILTRRKSYHLLNAIPFAEWQLFKGVWRRFIREQLIVDAGDIIALGPGRIEVTPVEMRTAIPFRGQVLSWKQEASVL